MAGHLHNRVFAFCVVGALAAILASCGSSSPGAAAPSGATITPPAAIKTAGQITFCSDPTYPPVEYYQGSTIVGLDPDIGAKIASMMGVKSIFLQTNFNGIVAALQSSQCDVIASGLFVTDQRKQVVDFIIYAQNGDQIMIKKGNPEGITGLDRSVAGKGIALEAGYNVIPEIQNFCQQLKTQGAQPCNVVLFPTGTDVAQALKTGKVDLALDGASVVAYRVSQNPSDFTFINTLLDPAQTGFAVRKTDTQLRDAIQTAVDKLYSDGTMCNILKKWSLAFMAVPGHKC